MHRESSDPARPRLGRRMQRKEWARQELLLAGRQLFSEKGLYESRVEDLARIAGIAKGTLYLYFRDKEDLIQAVVTAGFELLQQRVRERTEGARALSDVVSRIVATHLEFFVENPDLMRIFHQARGMLKFDRPRWRPLRVPLLKHLESVADLLGQTPSLAPLSPGERLDLAIQLFGVVSGVTSVRVAAKRSATAEVDAHALGWALVAAFKKRPAVGAALGRRRRPRQARPPRRRRVVQAS